MAKTQIDIENLDRKDMFKRFIGYSDPIGSATGTLKINKLVKFKKKGHKLNALINYCILNACYKIKEFHYALENDILYYYDDIAMLGVVKGSDNKLYLSSWKHFDNFVNFEANYKNVNEKVFKTNQSEMIENEAILSSSTMIQFPLDSVIINMGDEIKHCFFTWGAYKKEFFKYSQPITIRFHHAFFDGEQIALFFKYLQEEIDNLKI